MTDIDQMADLAERMRDAANGPYSVFDDQTIAMLSALCAQGANEIERLTAALKLISTGEPAAAGSAKPLSFKEWARMIAATALTGALR